MPLLRWKLISQHENCYWPFRNSADETIIMSRINIVDLEVFYQIGVTDEERAKPQRLLITVEMDFDFSTAAMSDRLEKTINYFDVAQESVEVRRAAQLEITGEADGQSRGLHHGPLQARSAYRWK